LIEWAALVIESIELGRLGGELAGIATCEYSIHFSNERGRVEIELNTTARGVQERARCYPQQNLGLSAEVIAAL
jgi:hypothetical protein